jgi:lipopolysaccharide transport system ATP-binding protein
MVMVKLENVNVDFPILQASARSIKKRLLSIATGGQIVATHGDTLVVRALSNINMTFQDGDRVALIGHNGSGKSTLLRTLAGVYKPTSGKIQTVGSIGTLLDSFIGIDLDATGLENITARGLCLGMKQSEINARIDEVADFAELGAFLELPMRTYSAGMQTRLAFSISTLIRPDILLLDEGIGTGDANFIAKAADRLNSFIASAGILIVASHDNTLINRLCNRAIVMLHGEAAFDGTVAQAIDYYKQSLLSATPGATMVAAE